MTKEEKLRMLQALSEKDLTKKFLIPLFESEGMGCKSVRYTHRRLEFGKDIIYYKEDEYGNRVYTGVQVKKTKIATKDVDGLLRQTAEAFGEPFTDLTDGKKRDLDKVVVLTSNEFLQESKDSFWASLRGANLNKLVTCIDGNQLVELLDRYLVSAFWDEYDHFNRYFHAMRRDFTTIKDVSAIGQKEAVSLEEIYVSLRVSEEMRVGENPAEEWKIFEEKRPDSRDKKVFRQREQSKVVDADRAVADYKRVVIVGDPGSGKTTLLKHLALKWCRENLERQERTSVPIPIVLRELAEKGKSIRAHIDDVFEKYEFPNAKKWVEKDLKAGNCRVLLDGFDELATRESQQKVAVEIEGFLKKYGKNPVVVTSRTAGYHDDLKGFAKAELMEFDDKQIARFIENWFGARDPDRAKAMRQAVMGSEQTKRIARNPLMVAIIAIIYEEDRRLPERRADLYERCVEVLLSKWDVQKRLKNRYAADKKEFILRKLAFDGHTNNKRIMTQEEIRGVMLGHFSRLGLAEEDFEPFLEEIWQRSFLLRQVSMDRYDFLHLSFQEYFTALELTQNEDGVSVIIEHLGEPWWEEPIVLYAGITKDASGLIRRIREDVPEDMFYSNLMLCGKCAADAEFTEAAVKEQLGNELYEVCMGTGFRRLKSKAAEVLGRLKPEKMTERLIADLGGADEDRRRRAAEALGEIGGEKAVEPLLGALRNKGRVVRWGAAYALGKIGGDEALEGLIKVLRDKDRNVRGSAAKALGEIGGEKVVEPLLKALRDQNSDVRGSAADALGRIGGEKAVEPLLEALRDQNSDVRGSAADALGRIGGEKAVEPLLQALRDKDDYVRRRAASALGRIGGEQVVEPLLEALRDKESDVRGSAADALGEIGVEKAVEPLLQSLRDKESDVRRRAAYALGKIGVEKAVEPLLKALRDKNKYVRGSAADALGRIGGEKAVEALLEALRDKEGRVRWHAADALGEIGVEKAVEGLLNALRDKEIAVRWAAAEALGHIGGERAVEGLKRALKDVDGNVRDEAFEALEAISRRQQIRIIR